MDRNFLPKSKKLPRKNDDTKMPRSKRVCKSKRQPSTPSTSAVNHADQSMLQISELTEKDIQQSNENSNCTRSNGSAYILEDFVSHGTDDESITNDNSSVNTLKFCHTSCANNVTDDSDNGNFKFEPIDVINKDPSFSSNDAVFLENATSNSSDRFQNKKTLSSQTFQLVTSNQGTSQMENFDTTQENSSQTENYLSDECERKIDTHLSRQKTPIIKHNKLRDIMNRVMSPKSENETTSLYSEYQFKSVSKEASSIMSGENLLSGTMLSETSDDNTEINETNRCCEAFTYTKFANKTMEQDTVEFQSISASPFIPSKEFDLDESYKDSMHAESENKIVIPTEVNEFQDISAPTPIPLKGVDFEENNKTKTLFKLSEPIKPSDILLIFASPVIPSDKVDLDESYKASMTNKSENEIVIPTEVNEFQDIPAPTPPFIPLNGVDFKSNNKTKSLFKFSEPIKPSDTTTKTIMAHETVTARKLVKGTLTASEEIDADKHKSAFKFSEPNIINENFHDNSSSNSAAENFESDLEIFTKFVSYQLRLLPRHIALECQTTMMETVLNERRKLLHNHDSDDCHQNVSTMEDIIPTQESSFENYI